MSAADPTISVILPTCDRLIYLREAIDSVFAQTLDDWELVIADDGSGEATRAYLQSLTSSSRVRVLWLPHGGNPAAVRNAALRAARGRYVAFLDSDDLWLPRKLELQLQVLRARPECGWSYTAFRRIDAGGRILAAEQNRKWVAHEGRIFEQLVRTEAAIRTPSVMAERRLIAAVGGFDETLVSAEDYDLWLRIALQSEVAVVDEPLVRVRLHDHNHSAAAESALACRDRSLKKLGTLADPRWRPLLWRERANNALLLSREYSLEKHHGRALLALGRSLPYGWPYAHWWLGTAKALIRPFLSPRTVEATHSNAEGS